MIEHIAISVLLQASGGTIEEVSEETLVLTPITVTARRIANQQPASTFSATATALRFDPQINLQARGLPEGQADVTVRGGLFENTGFRLGAVTVTDPQTGHYAVEIPLDPAMLSSPELMTDFDNGLNAFNATVATVSYGFATISDGYHLSAGIGTDSLLHGSARAGWSEQKDDGSRLAAVISASASSGDGTVENGDHDFKRFSGHLQWAGEGHETNLLLGYHDKFAGWPGMYTGFSTLPETDHTKLGLAVLDHRWTGTRGWWEVGAAYRWLEDDYDFDRRTIDSGGPGSFEHETRVFALAVTGLQNYAGLDWHVSGQFTADRLVQSTDLTHGYFNSRSYGSLGLAPQFNWTTTSGTRYVLRAGVRADLSNRDENAILPMAALSAEQPAGQGLNRYSIEYSKTSQLPGYTALNSRPQGLFGGNPDLDREYAGTLKVGFTHEAAQWLARATAFHRRDEDLVDWTYNANLPFSRQANAVDIDVTGLEGLISWQSATLSLTGGYTWLHKDEDYGTAEVDASYYALNYAEHRLTLAAVWEPSNEWAIRMDNEYRVHPENLLRSSRDSAYIASLSVNWGPDALPWFGISVVADNLTDSEFQDFPGTPPMGRQVSLGLMANW